MSANLTNGEPRIAKTGRPSVFSEEIADTLFERISDGESLRSICEDPGMPGRRTVFDWLEKDANFRARYCTAREFQADIAFDDMQDVADAATPETVRVAELRISTMQWRLSKLLPKKYGVRQAIEHSGSIGKPMTLAELDARIEKSHAQGV